MLNRNSRLICCIAAGVFSSGVAFAQSVTTGALTGVVLDRSGSPVVGANVKISSGQIVRSTVTNADGRYQISLLNAGNWVVAVSKAGFTVQSQTVTVNVNSTLTANFTKMSKEVSATVEIVSTASSIDSASTTTGSNFTMETLSAIPKGRDMNDMAFMTPGVTTSGFGAANGNANLGLGISIGGASGAENSFSVDGLKTNDMRYGGQSVNMVTEFVEQIDVQTGGYKPEYSSMGGVFNVLTKSGSNDFAGTTWVTYSPSALSPNPKSTLWTKELPHVTNYDLGAWVGGALVKDKFFYSVGVNYNLDKSGTYTNFSDLPVGGTKTPNLQFMGKLQFYANLDNQLTLSYFGNQQTATQDPGNCPTNLYDGRGDANAAGDTVHNTSNFNIIWDSVISSNINLSVKAGQANATNKQTPEDTRATIRDQTYYAAGGPGENAGLDPRTYWASGSGMPNTSNETNKTTQFAMDLNWIVGGNHALKFGYSWLKSNYADKTDRTGGQTWMLRMRNDGAGGQGLRAIQNFYHNDSEANAYFQAVYAQDTWEAGKGLNLFYGFRMEDQKQVGATGATFMHFKFTDYIQPRLGFTWDIKGDGYSKLSGSFAQYFMQIPQRMAIRTYGKEQYFLNYFGAGATDADGNPIPSGSTASYNRATSTVSVTGTRYSQVDYSTGWSQDPIVDGTKLPKRIEFLLGYDQQINASTTLGIHGHYRKLTNPIEDSEITTADGTPRDPADNVGGQAVIWNPRPGPITWTSPFSGQKVTVSDTLYPEAYNDYKAVDLTYTYKTQNSFLFVGYTWSREYGNYEGLISATNGQPDGGITASYDYWPYVGTGYLPTDHTHMIKAYGSQKFKLGKGDLSLGFNFLAQSGRPYSLQDDGSTSNPVLPDPGSYMNADFQDLKLGNKGRTSWLTRLDFTVSYRMILQGKTTLEPSLQLYNVMNHRPETSVVEQGTDRYGTPMPAGKWSSATSWQDGRAVRFGLALRF